MEVMDRSEPRAEDLVALLEVPQIRARIVSTRITRAGSVDGPRIGTEAAVADIERPFAREKLAVARMTRRHHVVEHVHAARNGLHEIGRRADAHQVPGPLARQLRSEA